uniref:FACT complex subunit SSRP1 n=2 Tax=Rhizochromulina marina TaxID=1034831 RepID=A0A7S2WS60_9STRA
MAATTFDSIGLVGYAVGTLRLDGAQIRWAPRNAEDSAPRDVDLDQVLRVTWSPVGRRCHVKLFLKEAAPLRFEGFRKADIESIKSFLTAQGIAMDQEEVETGGGNYGALNFDDAGVLNFTKEGKQMFEINLSNVSQCVTPGNKQDELEVQFIDADSSTKDDQLLYSMRLWIPGQQASEYQSSVLQKTNISSHTGDVLIEFDRDQATFVAPKNRYNIELYDSFLRMHGNMYDYKIRYSDISRFYMLQKPTSSGPVEIYSFVICLDKPIRQGQQKYPYLVWQTNNEEEEITINLSEEAIEERFPGSGLAPSMTGPLHRLIGKIFKSFTRKTVFAGSRRFRSADEFQCVSCALGPRNGFLYPNDKSFVFLHQPTMVIEYTDVEYVEFEKTKGARNFDLVVQQKSTGKKHKFGAIEKKEFGAISEFLKTKDAFFHIRNLEQSEEPEEEQDDESDEEDEDFEEGDEASDSDSAEEDDENDEVEMVEEDGAELAAEVQPSKAPKTAKAAVAGTKKRKLAAAEESPKKAKKDANAPKAARSAYQLWSNSIRAEIKERDPTLSMGDVSKELGTRWKALGLDEKAPWQAKAKEDKARYNDEMASYEPPEGTGKPAKKRRPKDPNAPKKPLTAYFLFLAKERGRVKEQNPDASFAEIGKLCGQKWKEMTLEEKAPFEAENRDAVAKYKEQLAAYNATGSVPTEEGDAAEEDTAVKAEETSVEHQEDEKDVEPKEQREEDVKPKLETMDVEGAEDGGP